jgi:cation:H+ antiporter
MVTTALLLLAGLTLLVAGGELLLRGASKLAVSLGISPLVIGLTVVAFGTSAPEFAVSLQSSFTGKVDIALGNVVGSNIFNVLFILGISAAITPLVVAGQMIRQEVPVLVGASVLVLALALDGAITRWEGLLLVALLAAYTVFVIRQSRHATKALQEEYAEEAHIGVVASWDDTLLSQVLLIAGGLVLLVFGSRWLVAAAVAIAQAAGVSELVIGLTVVAAGTSLPEVAASIGAAIKGQRDIAVGNVVGSNVFNLLGVLGLSAAVAPAALPVATSMLHFDVLVMVAVAVACLPVFFTGFTISRWEGWLFLFYYAAYTGYLVLRAQEHDALGTYALVLGTFVLPLTAVTLAVVAFRAARSSHGARPRR